MLRPPILPPKSPEAQAAWDLARTITSTPEGLNRLEAALRGADETSRQLDESIRPFDLLEPQPSYVGDYPSYSK